MNKHERNIQALLLVARDVTPVSGARIAASIWINNRQISLGINAKRGHPLQAKFARKKECSDVHAEIDALVNALRVVRVDELKNSVMYIARSKYTAPKETGGILTQGIAKPCSGCARALRSFGIKKVIYTTSENTIEEL